jgi:hypothetical protein
MPRWSDYPGAISAMTPKELTPRQALWRSIQMVGQAAPRELKRLALLNLLTGIGPSISLFLGKVVIDEVARLVDQGGVSQLGCFWSRHTARYVSLVDTRLHQLTAGSLAVSHVWARHPRLAASR